MNIAVFGLGYVGCVGIGCLAKSDNQLIGVDISQEKVDLINAGKPTIVEAEISELIAEGSKAGRISATTDYKRAVQQSDISFICVGTPNRNSGHLELSAVKQVAQNIGESLKEKNGFHTVVIRSTVTPGTNNEISRIISQSSGKLDGVDFCVISNPEFLREGTAVSDYFNPSITVIGGSSSRGIDLIMTLYSDLGGLKEIVSIEVAEMIKYVNNSYHALKIAFANEVGSICKMMNIDGREVMNLFCKDDKLNLSKAYLKPGNAYGGSCLPKDLLGLNALGHDLYLSLPVLKGIGSSNKEHIDRIISKIIQRGIKSVGFVGIAFKAGTDDLRQSPAVVICEALIGKGKEIFVYDENVRYSAISGTNKSFIDEHIPHISSKMVGSIEELTRRCELIVISQKSEGMESIITNQDNIQFYDLTGLNKDLKGRENYEGVCW